MQIWKKIFSLQNLTKKLHRDRAHPLKE